MSVSLEELADTHNRRYSHFVRSPEKFLQLVPATKRLKSGSFVGRPYTSRGGSSHNFPMLNNINNIVVRGEESQHEQANQRKDSLGIQYRIEVTGKVGLLEGVDFA